MAECDLEQLDQIKNACSLDPFLIIIQGDGLALKGAHINFYTDEDQNIHFEMNKSFLDECGFEVDCRLLQFSTLITN